MSEQLAVLGSPIGHSLSPDLHRAAYRTLGLDWNYERIELQEPELGSFLAGRGRDFRGFSVTMPLKSELLRLATDADIIATRTGAANTVIGMRTGELTVFNTDVAGMVRALTPHRTGPIRHGIVIGAGATAASALAALAELGAETVDVRLRDPRKAGPLISQGRELGLVVLADHLDPQRAELPVEPADVLISTVPTGALDTWAPYYREAAPLALDVAYDPWPSRFATDHPGNVVSGLHMLLHQALIQIRIFVTGSPFEELHNEEAVLAAMRGAIPALCQD